jgi:hypothetical protein
MTDIKEIIKKKQKPRSYEYVKPYIDLYRAKHPEAITRAKKNHYEAHKQEIFEQFYAKKHPQTVYNKEARRQRNILLKVPNDAEHHYDYNKKRYAFIKEAKRMRDMLIDL